MKSREFVIQDERMGAYWNGGHWVVDIPSARVFTKETLPARVLARELVKEGKNPIYWKYMSMCEKGALVVSLESARKSQKEKRKCRYSIKSR